MTRVSGMDLSVETYGGNRFALHLFIEMMGEI